jgi:ribosomal protein L37E
VRPEIECCRKCGYDLRDHQADYVVCPECGMPNNREMARREYTSQTRPAARWTLACVAGCVSYVPGAIVGGVAAAALQTGTIGDVLAFGLVTAVLVGAAVFLIVWSGDPPDQRTMRRVGALAAVCLLAGGVICVAMTVVLAAVMWFVLGRPFW